MQFIKHPHELNVQLSFVFIGCREQYSASPGHFRDKGISLMRSLHQLLPPGTIFALTLTLLCATLAAPARAADAGCEPGKMAANYPTLVGKIVKIGQDGES